MGRPRSRRARQRIALALCVTWIVGFELAPWLHVALHDHLAPHHHDASGEVLVGEDHHHGDDLDAEVDEHGAPVEHRHDHDVDVDDDIDAEVDVVDEMHDRLFACAAIGAIETAYGVREPVRTCSNEQSCGVGEPPFERCTNGANRSSDRMPRDGRFSFERRSNDALASAEDRSLERVLTSFRTRVSCSDVTKRVSPPVNPDALALTDATDVQARVRRALSHGAHSLAHHGIAVPVPAPAITEPLPIDRRPFALAAIVACTPTSPPAATPSARGPPSQLI